MNYYFFFESYEEDETISMDWVKEIQNLKNIQILQFYIE